MSSIFVVVDEATAQEQNSITDLFKSKGWGYWHWVHNIWVLDTPSDESYRIGELRDEIKKLVSDEALIFVTDASSRNWGGWGNPEKFNWFNENWK